MSARRYFSPWVLTIVFALCAVAVPLIHQLLPPPAATPPPSLPDLAERLRRAGLSLHVVPMTHITPVEGLYLCERPQPREQLQRLVRAVEHSDSWRGVVFCECNKRLGEVSDEQMADWGEHGMRLGPFVFFGDPALLRRIRQALPEM
jgi:hypothetical protein